MVWAKSLRNDTDVVFGGISNPPYQHAHRKVKAVSQTSHNTPSNLLYNTVQQ